MNQNFTYVSLLIDRSGSMEKIRKDMQGGLKVFADEQRKVEGKIKVSLFDFDGKVQTIGENRDLDILDSYQITPRGSTALYDGIGYSVVRTGELLDSMPEEERPGKVLFVIVTDGEENSSKEYKSDQIKEMIAHQRERYNWEFVYLGANQDAITVANRIGIGTSNAITYEAGGQGVNNVMRAFSKQSAMYRSAGTSLSFSDDDRKKAMKRD